MASRTDTEGEAAAPLLSLADLVNNATRHQHTTLNKLITSRLPLCLPPHATAPHNYLLGLSQISAIFFAFESLWDEITSPANSAISSLDNSTYGSVDAYPHPREDALISGLRNLRPMGLPRSERLRHDLKQLRHVCQVEENDEGISDVVEGIVIRMENEVRQKPYLLVAYAFTLYLAVLSGGRHIRSELCKAGVDFWTGTTSAAQADTVSTPTKSSWNWRSPVPSLGRLSLYAKPSTPAPEAPSDSPTRSHRPLPVSEISHFASLGLSLWFFPGPADGEDLRAKFKANLEDLAGYISPRQEDEIIAEAQMIFSQVEALVGELDVAAATGRALGATAGQEPEITFAKDVTPEPIEITEAEPIVTTAPSLARATEPIPVLGEMNGLAGPWWVGLAVVMCGISYAAVVYSNTWAGL